jgi:dCMP deaminase
MRARLAGPPDSHLRRRLRSTARSDDALPWAREAASGSQLDTKYPYVCHAEMNAVLNRNTVSCHKAGRSPRATPESARAHHRAHLPTQASSRGARLYATLFPCNDCAKLIIQAGIAEVVFLSDKYHDAVPFVAARRLFDLAGVAQRHFKPKMREVVVRFES